MQFKIYMVTTLINGTESRPTISSEYTYIKIQYMNLVNNINLLLTLILASISRT